MPELITVTSRSQPRGIGRWSRMWRAVRSAWSGTFSLKDPALNHLFGVGSRSLAGPVVNEHTAFTCSAVYDAVNQIASDIAKLPLDLLKRRQDGGSEPYTDSKTYKLLKFAPNPEMTSMVLRRTMMTHALIGQGGFAEIERDKAGRPLGLWVIEPHRVRVDRDLQDRLVYVIDGDAAAAIPATDMIHIRGLGWDGITGFEMVQLARQAIGLALASEQFAASFFGNGTRFGGILMSDQDLDEPQKEEIRGTIEKLHARADKAFRMLVLGAGFKYESAGVKPSEAQMKEIRDQQVQEVARFYNMPLHKLKSLERATNNNIEQQDLEYYKGCILNWVTLWEQELGAKLIPSLELGQQYFKHNANAFLRGDIKSRYEALGIARDKGIINADEWRAFEDWNPQPGGQGQLYLVQSAQVPLGKLAELTDAEIENKKTPAPPPAPPPAEPPSDGGDTGAAAAASARAVAAEAAAAAALAALQVERDARIAAEATGQATAAQLEDLRESEQKARAHAEQLTVLAADQRRTAETLQAQKEAAEAARRDEAQAAAAHAVSLEARLQDASDAALAGEVYKRELAEAQAERDRLVAEARASAADAIAEARNEAEAARRHMADREAAQRTAEAAATAAQEALRHASLQAEAQLAETAAQLATLRAEMRERRLATLTAHRGLIVDALGRMTRREAQQARAKQATPEKLRRWLEGFPTLHEAICVEALLPAMRTHLAWTGSAEDPADATTTLVRAHVALFVQQLRAVLEAEPDEFHVTLDRVLTRWETERAPAVADALLQEEIRHVA